jgi:hypothetical protein
MQKDPLIEARMSCHNSRHSGHKPHSTFLDKTLTLFPTVHRLGQQLLTRKSVGDKHRSSQCGPFGHKGPSFTFPLTGGSHPLHHTGCWYMGDNWEWIWWSPRGRGCWWLGCNKPGRMPHASYIYIHAWNHRSRTKPKERVNLAIVSAWHFVLRTSLLQWQQHVVVSLCSYDCTYLSRFG